MLTDIHRARAIAGTPCTHPLLHSQAVGSVEIAGLERRLTAGANGERGHPVRMVPAMLPVGILELQVAVGIVLKLVGLAILPQAGKAVMGRAWPLIRRQAGKTEVP